MTVQACKADGFLLVDTTKEEHITYLAAFLTNRRGCSDVHSAVRMPLRYLVIMPCLASLAVCNLHGCNQTWRQSHQGSASKTSLRPAWDSSFEAALCIRIGFNHTNYPSRHCSDQQEGLPSAPKPADVKRAEGQLENCIATCAETYHKQIPKMRAETERDLQQLLPRR